MIKALAFGISVLVIAWVAAFILQRQLLYYPLQHKPDKNRFSANMMQTITLETADGLTLESWYHPPASGKPVILYLHGNAGHIGLRMSQARYFIQAGLGILLLEYRGYGGNPGVPTESGLYKDARAALTFLHDKGFKDQQIILYGESLGTGIATKMAIEMTPCAVILQSPYTSMHDLARIHYPFIPIPMRDQYNSLERIQLLRSPVLFVHGTKDTIVPVQMGEKLFKAAPATSIWKTFDRQHNDLWDDSFATTVIDYINHQCKG